jgi:hypothetical protein
MKLFLKKIYMRTKYLCFIPLFGAILFSVDCTKNVTAPTQPHELPKVSTFLNFLGVRNKYDPYPYYILANYWEYGGEIIDSGGLKITASGVKLYDYKTNSTKLIPSLDNYIYEVLNVGWVGRGNPSYSVQAYAINALGTSYGKTISF